MSNLMNTSVEENAKEGSNDAKTSITNTLSVATSTISTKKIMDDSGSHSILGVVKKKESCVPKGEDSTLIENNPQRIQGDIKNNDLQSSSSDSPKLHSAVDTHKMEIPLRNDKNSSRRVIPFAQSKQNIQLEYLGKRKISMNTTNVTPKDHSADSDDRSQFGDRAMMHLHSPSTPQSPAMKSTKFESISHPRSLAQVTFSTKSHTVNTSIGVLASPLKSNIIEQGPNEALHRMPYMIYQNKKSKLPISENKSERTHVTDNSSVKSMPSLFLGPSLDFQAKANYDALNVDSSPANTKKNESQNHLIHKTSTNDTERSGLTSAESEHDKNKKLRSKLVDTFAPYIHPTDNSLADARKRLRVALDQTRMLREAFSDRVYRKYRVVLRPVERNVNDIIEPIKTDPVSMKAEISRQIKTIKIEKEVEKKEAQKLNSEFAATHNPGETNYFMHGVENAEQLSWFCAGLNLVILPEEEVNISELEARGIQHRGPINPETGARVGGISSAAATAANAMLDRVRKGAAMRVDRKIKYASELYLNNSRDISNHTVEQPVFSSIISSKSPLVASNPSLILEKESVLSPTSGTSKQSQRTTNKKGILQPKSGSQSKKQVKSKKVKASGFGVNLLSIMPNGEGLLANGKTPSAMYALISCGVGNNAPKKPSKAMNGQRWRHPFPQSKAAKVISTAISTYGQSAKRVSLGSQAMKSIISTLPSETKKILLYPTSQNILKRRNIVPLRIDNHYHRDCKSATKKAVKSIIERFYFVANVTSEPTSMKAIDEIGLNKKVLTQTSRKINQHENKTGNRLMKRNVTEMGLLRDIRSAPAHCRPLTVRLDENNRLQNQKEKGNNISRESNEDNHRLAVSILYAIGLISNSPTHSISSGNMKSSSIQTNEENSSKFQFETDDENEQISLRTSSNQLSSDDSIARPSFHVVDRLFTKSVTDSILLHETPEHDINNCQQHTMNSIAEKKEDKSVAKSNPLNSSEKILIKNKSPSKPVIKHNQKSQIDQVNGIGSYYIPNLRGGGDSNMNVSKSSLSTSSKKKEEIRKSSTTSNQPPIDASQIDGSVSFPISLSRGGSMINAPPNVNGLGGASVLSPPISSPAAIQRQQQIHNQFGHSNDLIQSTVLWGDQRNDLSSLHSQTGGVSMLPPHIASSSLDGAYSIIAQATARTNTNTHNNFSPTPSPSPNGLPMTASTAARLQGQHQQHQSLSALHHSSNHANPEVPDFFTPNLHQLQQPTVSFGSAHHDWTTLGAAAGLLPAHSSLASTMGLTSHQAAMVSLTVRERAARAILAKQHRHHQQQHHSGVHARAQAAAAAHNASVNRGAPSISNLSAQQATHFLGNSTGNTPAVSFKKSTHNMFQNINIQSSPPTPILSPSSTIPTLQSRHKQSTSKVLKNHKSSSQKKKQAIAIVDSTVTIHNSNLIPENSKLSVTNEIQKNSLKKKSSQNLARYEKTKSETMSQEVSTQDQVIVQGNTDFSTQNDKEKTEDLHHKSCVRNSENQTVSPVPLTNSKEDKPVPKIIDQNHIDGRSHDLHDSHGERPKTNFKVNAHILKSQPDATSKSELSLFKLSSIELGGKLQMISTSGLQFFIPNPPSGISQNQAIFILKSEFYKAVEESNSSLESPDENQSRLNSKTMSLLLDYLLSVGAAVPIPKAIIQNPIKEKFNSLPLKNSLSYLGNISFTFPREVVASCITIWLWATHQSSFEKAFTKSGRIDVDPECKWLINAAIDAAMKALRPDHAELSLISETRSQKNSERLGLSYDQSFNLFDGPIASSNDITSIAVNMAYAVSKKLMRQFRIDTKVDSMIYNLDNLMEHLDDLRLCSLRARSQERALLAAFISRHVLMSDSFSNAYTSSMIRAGEALGYEDLCEIVQDESAFTSTLMPFDILSDSTGAWEDPCRPANGFIPGFSGDELTRKAHARALIQKSLKKIQDRYKIDGGTSHAGPYTDPEKGSGGQLENTTLIGTALPPKSSQSLNRTLSGLKRKPSFSGISDPTGLVQGKPSSAVSALFNPNHYSSPFIWDNDQIDNMPYGRSEICADTKLQVSDVRLGSGSVKRQCRLSPSKTDDLLDKNSHKNKGIFRSTHEIEWAEIAGKFEIVSSTERSSQSRSSTSHTHSTPVPIGSKIFAPYCSLIDFSNLPSDSDISDNEEDISDNAILDRHQKVLDGMKEKLDALMEVRQHYQDRSRRSSVR